MTVVMTFVLLTMILLAVPVMLITFALLRAIARIGQADKPSDDTLSKMNDE